MTNNVDVGRATAIARTALEQYPFKVNRLRCVSTRFSTISRVDTDSEVYALRLVANRRDALQIESEMIWLEAICTQTDVIVPIPQRTTDGDWLVILNTESESSPQYVTVGSWLSGHTISCLPTPEKLDQLGELVAKLHLHARQFQVSPKFTTFDTYTVDEWGALDYLEGPNSPLSAHQQALFREAITVSEGTLRELREDAASLYLIHADIHPKNAKYYRDQVSLFDFDDFRWGHFLQDLAPMLAWLDDNRDTHGLQNAFIRGYERVCPFRLIRKAIIYRRMVDINFVIHYHSGKRVQRAIEGTTRWLEQNL